MPPPVMGSFELHFGIACDETAPASARRCLERFADRMAPELLEDIRLLLNELVTNSVRHGCSDGGWIRLTIACSPQLVRVEVADPGAGFESGVPEPRLDDIGGRGLMLVDRMSDRWGTERRSSFVVWFERDVRVHQHA